VIRWAMSLVCQIPVMMDDLINLEVHLVVMLANLMMKDSLMVETLASQMMKAFEMPHCWAL